nr:MAG TPA: hypothetical protein [Caudoviricetes sp.]
MLQRYALLRIVQILCEFNSQIKVLLTIMRIFNL